ncbi:MAG: hypothetical protein BWY79_02010 [Actinobacteria bacterium ADurb.Bin444]|nr:MAG: hypothetical protein BWY79_02010 [Actinobacteria bacterium ADurb.Bin444]
MVACISSEAFLFRALMHWTACSTDSGVASPPLIPVLMMPTPSGLVRMSLSPSRHPVLGMTREGWMTPVTERPYLNSLSSTL